MVGIGLVGCGPYGKLPNDGGNDSPPGAADVHVVITADNSYGFGYGTITALSHYFDGVEDGGGQIFFCSAACDAQHPCGGGISCDQFGTCNGDRNGPETYVVPNSAVAVAEYLYVVTWSDELVTQGLVAQFASSTGDKIIYTGDEAWEVCATGRNFNYGSGGPSVAVIDEFIQKCSLAPEATFSNGWVGTTPNAERQALVVMPLAEESETLNRVCGRQPADFDKGDALDLYAEWIWFDDDVTAEPSAFLSNGQPRGDFLIFRLPLELVVPVS